MEVAGTRRENRDLEISSANSPHGGTSCAAPSARYLHAVALWIQDYLIWQTKPRADSGNLKIFTHCLNFDSGCSYWSQIGTCAIRMDLSTKDFKPLQIIDQNFTESQNGCG